jgi:hypothetical protein
MIPKRLYIANDLLIINKYSYSAAYYTRYRKKIHFSSLSLSCTAVIYPIQDLETRSMFDADTETALSNS